MPLESLIPELIFMIASHLGLCSLASLSGSCRGFYHLLTRELHQRAVSDDGGLVGLHHAAYTENLSLASSLLTHGADPNVQDKNYMTALHCAAEIGNVAVARLLIQHGAVITVQNHERRGVSVLKNAACYGNVGFIEFILEEMEARGVEVDVSSALSTALYEDRVDVVRVCLKHGIAPAFLDWSIRIPISEGYTEIVRLMIEAGADVDSSWSSWRLLHLAAHRGYAAIVKLLLEHGAEVDPVSQSTHDGPKTPLVVAAKTAVLGVPGQKYLAYVRRSGPEESVRLLIRWGADVDWAIHLVGSLRMISEDKENIVEYLRSSKLAHI